jgi:RecB family nuclease, putative, TM0106 family
MQKSSSQIIYSPSDLIVFVKSPFASWMDRHHLEHPELIKPDTPSADQKLIADTGDRHEQAILAELKSANQSVFEIEKKDFESAFNLTCAALSAGPAIIYQAALRKGVFAGYSDFLILDAANKYEVWDTKLARSPKPYFAIQLCCYSEMLAEIAPGKCAEKFGVILGTKERVEFRIEDFIHYYGRVKRAFLDLQAAYNGDLAHRPEPLAGADHGRWTSHAEEFFDDTDHLVRVAGITVGQIKKLRSANITTMEKLAVSAGVVVPKLAGETLEKLAAQARLQCATRSVRKVNPAAPACFELLPPDPNGQRVGFSALPPPDASDVYFDMEGYPLAEGGLEYLFGACSLSETGEIQFSDWWGHDRVGEKAAFEGFVDWVYARWNASPAMHIYHYAAYEVSAIRRLSIRHDTHQDEVDQLLRNEVFVDLYQTVRHGLRLGEESYSIKLVERLYRPKRITEVATALDSVVQYAHWLESGASGSWADSSILKSIRDYNEDDCRSTLELCKWLRDVAAECHAPTYVPKKGAAATPVEGKELPPEVIERLKTIEELRRREDALSHVLADVLDFHRRDDKPMWWRMFDRAVSTPEELRDDSGCIEGVCAAGAPVKEKLSLVQTYQFDPRQECKLAAKDKAKVMFTHDIKSKLNLVFLDAETGVLKLKIAERTLKEKFDGKFPSRGSLLPDESVSPEAMQLALTEIGKLYLGGDMPSCIRALLERQSPQGILLQAAETTLDAAVRIVKGMNGSCLVIQGPPGTGKTFTAANMISSLVQAGRKVGITSNSHKAVLNLMKECGIVMKAANVKWTGIKVGGGADDEAFREYPQLKYVAENKEAAGTYSGGIIGGTAWLFSRPEWAGALDVLFIDEAGQVSLANAVAVARAAANIVLLGDQMQLEQPTEGSHPGDSGLSCLQYALKDLAASRPDAPVFHAVVPEQQGLFLGQSRRMHPSVCQFISDSIYEGRLTSHESCATQKLAFDGSRPLISSENGIVFVGVEHDGDIQQSDEEVTQVRALFDALNGREYTNSKGEVHKLELSDFLFIAPYNAQVRALKAALPADARVASVDKFQGQQAPVCILSLCSSYGEYGSRGLGFILDRNRLNVALSRAQCLAVVVADPRIANATAGSLAEMTLLNLFCKLVDYTS